MMVQERIYALTLSGEWLSIDLGLGIPYKLDGARDWACLVELSSSDGQLDYSLAIYQVSAMSVCAQCLKLMTQLLNAAKDQKGWILYYEPHVGAELGDEPYPFFC